MKRLIILAMCVVFVAATISIASAESQGVGPNAELLKGQARAIQAHTLNRGVAKACGLKDLPAGNVTTVDEYGRITSIVVAPLNAAAISYSINVVYPSDINDPTCTVTYTQEYIQSSVTLVTSYSVPDTPDGVWTLGEYGNTGDPSIPYFRFEWTYVDGNPKPFYYAYLLSSSWDEGASALQVDIRKPAVNGGQVSEYVVIIGGSNVLYNWIYGILDWDGRQLVSEDYQGYEIVPGPQEFMRYKMDYVYDGAGRRVGGTYTGYDASNIPIVTGQIQYTYDLNDPSVLLSEQIVDDATGLALVKTIYEYDESGNLIRLTTESSVDLREIPIS